MQQNQSLLHRTAFMLIGNLLISICVASYRLSGLGVDAFTGMNLGISGFLGMSFGNWQLIVNILLLVLVFFTIRHCIGMGTVVNMVCVGYIADFVCWLAGDVIGLEITLPLRIFFVLLGLLFASSGVALYMHANMGTAPYDSLPLIIQKFTKERVSFRAARVGCDITSLVIGVLFCLAAKGDVTTIIGVGTVCNAFFNGPLIQFFRDRIEK